MHKVAWQHVFVGIRHTTTLCYLCVRSNQRYKKGGYAVRAVVTVALHGGVVDWWSGGVVEWWSGGVVEWWSGGVVEW